MLNQSTPKLAKIPEHLQRYWEVALAIIILLVILVPLLFGIITKQADTCSFSMTSPRSIVSQSTSLKHMWTMDIRILNYGNQLLIPTSDTLFISSYCGKNEILSVKMQSGQANWRFSRTAFSMTLDQAYTKLYITDDMQIDALSAQDGNLLWSVQPPEFARRGAPKVSRITVDNQRLILYSYDGTRFLDIRGDVSANKVQLTGWPASILPHQGIAFSTEEGGLPRSIKATDISSGKFLWESPKLPFA